MTVEELLKQLVDIDSVNPSLAPGAAGEREIADFVASWAIQAGLAVEVLEATPSRPNVIVRTTRGGPGRRLMLCGHLDTVGLGQSIAKSQVDGDRLYGRGSYDMKAGLAAALIACRDANVDSLAGEVVVACVADEEHASLGVQEVLSVLTADAAIVCEPTESTVAVAHKGFVWTEIEVVGRAAHGSRPELGVDAIMRTGPVLVALDRLGIALRQHEHPRLGPGALHASLINGGREESTVPDRCVLTIERRTLPGESVADVERDIQDLLASCQADDPALVASHRTTLAREPFETIADSEIVTLLADVSGAEITGVSYWADSAFISAAGIPTVLFGPSGDGAHADVEWVSLADTARCAETLTATALRFCH
ncbi:M20/M25/M40 family metallo-hydrolase [Kutzneria sp. NPDC052558]|uniref:M20/M25/M40 family metallo-hydrolase n=1 Tax=Kutzneria sp. NPDC052558 TaxID=3364121 RepID=UPI0037C7A046